MFLGDYFDCFEDIDNDCYFSVKNVCKWLNETSEELGDKAIWLIGNHDVSYRASYLPNTYNVRKNSFFNCSGWTKSKASDINKYLNPDFWDRTELCCVANGYVLSHAGFHYNHFQPLSSEMDNIERLYEEWEATKNIFFDRAFHWIWDIGGVRGGNEDVGSPVWLDWNCEFVDMPGIPQIVGHTNSYVHRQRGNSYCIDAYRSTYCVLEPGKLRPDFYIVDAEPKKKKLKAVVDLYEDIKKMAKEETPECPICKSKNSMIRYPEGWRCHGTHRIET